MMQDPVLKWAFWLGQVEGWKRSGQSQRAFAAAQGISYSGLRRWVARLSEALQADDGPSASEGGHEPAGPLVPGAIPRDIPSAEPLSEVDVLSADDAGGSEFLSFTRPVRAEILTGLERRRRFTREEKLRLVAEAGRPGQSISQVAHRAGIGSDLLFRWRRQFRAEFGLVPAVAARDEAAPSACAAAPIVPVRVASAPSPTPRQVPRADGASHAATPSDSSAGRIEIELVSGHRLRVDPHVDPDALARVIAVLQASAGDLR